MKNTREKILNTALTLFNTYGLAKVTLRTIATTMGISQGNLNYHFKKREEIIEALYFQLVRQVDDVFAAMPRTDNDLSELFTMAKAIMENFYAYRFFLLDFVQVVRDNTKIRKHYAKLSALREAQFKAIFSSWVAAGFLRKEILPGEYASLYQRLHILTDFWLSAAALQTPVLTGKSIQRYATVINREIFPYLTGKGREAYFRLHLSAESG